MLRAALTFAALLFAASAEAGFSGSIVDAAFVAKARARGAIVWDVRTEDAYWDGHIPGAVNLGSVSKALLDEKTQQFLPIEEIAARFGDAGIDLKREIVVYGVPGSAYAYFAQFALEYFGATRVHVFNDGMDGWRAAKQPVSTAPTPRKPVKVRPFAVPPMLVTTGEVMSRVGSPNVQFIDTRTPAEYSGEQSETLLSGHIPGAVNIPYSMNLVDRKLKKPAELRKLYAGLDKRKETIVYCTTGIRAALTAVVLANLGFSSVRLYHASWYEYGNQPEAPVN